MAELRYLNNENEEVCLSIDNANNEVIVSAKNRTSQENESICLAVTTDEAIKMLSTLGELLRIEDQNGM